MSAPDSDAREVFVEHGTGTSLEGHRQLRWARRALTNARGLAMASAAPGMMQRVAVLDPAPSIHPRLAGGATPIVLRSAATDLVGALGIPADQLTSVGDRVLSVRIEVPPGEWLVWPEHEYVMWIGARIDALPAQVRRLAGPPSDTALTEVLDGLADAGIWLREAAVHTAYGWSSSQRPGDVALALAVEPASALSGVFVDRDGQAARLEVTALGIWWTDHPARAVQWLLAAHQLPAPL